MTDSNDNISEIQLPGYTLERRIGEGGYGEVWLANAPGGLTKAVKFIFGFHNEKRAASELRSLEKIKAVRHPFLLSLERIEVIEGRLVIVTELADGSLRDRFDACVRDGQTGIARDELLGYLRDSADALDYLSDKHSLQHLDVKPENFLLVAGHVKVADFGLVKEIQETQASLVGGMTPLYSAPEVFQGRPTSYSDQYSLAVLYQEMLTGILPFGGTTSAELTLQHMHDDPNLSPLPLADRYVLARALSKDPMQRYASCREFVQALMNADSASETDWTQRTETPSLSSPSTPPLENRKSRPGTMTQVFDEDLVKDPAEVSKSMLLDMPLGCEQEHEAPPALDLRADDAQPTSTLVIGIGGTAASVLGQFRRKLSERYGTGSNVPAIQLLLLDTDKKSLVEATHADSGMGLASEETLALQLRRPQEYRECSKRLLGWLSRRWLYNIPKSLRTEGLRPLGRLAFADHARRTVQRIRLALSQAMDEDSLNESNQQTGLSFDGQKVKVYVVASISGGTGSGMSIDVGYAVKSLLEKLGIENADTTGILMHSTGRDSRFCDLAKVNAFSWLKEYSHFARPEGFYPGDEASGLPAMPHGTPAFDNTYFVPLGDGLTPEQLEKNTASIAQYLLLDSLTAANRFFDASRQTIPSLASGYPALRTFGLHEESVVSQSMLDEVAQRLCHRVVSNWSGTQSGFAESSDATMDITSADQDTTAISDTNQIVCGAPRAVAQLQLNLEGISANARTILENQFGNDAEVLIADLLMNSQVDAKPLSPATVTKLVDSLFVGESGTESAGHEAVNGRQVDAIVSPLGMKLASDLQRWLLHRLDEGQERLSGTRQAAEWFVEHLKRVDNDTKRLAKGIGSKLLLMIDEVADQERFRPVGEGGSPDDPALVFALKYFRMRLDLRALQATSHLVRILQSELKSVREAIVEFGRHLRHLADSVTAYAHMDGQSNASPFVAGSLGQQLAGKLGELTNRVDEQLQLQYINTHGGLFQTVMGNQKIVAELLDTLRRLAAEQVGLAARELQQTGDSQLDDQSLAGFAERARPPLSELGGVSQQLVVLSQSGDIQQIASSARNALDDQSSVLVGECGNPTVCCEAGLLPLARVAVDLIECRRDYAEFADRVHTRNDISWTPLIEVDSPQPSTSSECATQVLPQAY